MPPAFVIVRRGHFATFELLTRTFAEDPGVFIIWDRRVADRRQRAGGGEERRDRRQGDRRRTPPLQWRQVNYMMSGEASV